MCERMCYFKFFFVFYVVGMCVCSGFFCVFWLGWYIMLGVLSWVWLVFLYFFYFLRMMESISRGIGE